jgi:EAL domain-containing protein (putative c-di-GMP-specific phosphodiesterase class I)
VNRVQLPHQVDEPELQRALDCGELIRLYQPVVDLRTGAVVQVEALLRWDHPGRGLLAPGEFLVDEDDSSLLVRIGWSVVIEASRRACVWRRTFPHRPITVSVNLFDDHLARRDLPNRVQHLLEDDTVTQPPVLAVEVGEHHLLERRIKTRDRLTVLRNVGVDVVIDDLGASVGSTDLAPDELLEWAVEVLSALRSFPLAAVKLDREFARRLETEERLRAVVDAAHAAGLVIIALAVEIEEVADRVRRAGFDLAQGFYFARPERPSRIDELLALR